MTPLYEDVSDRYKYEKKNTTYGAFGASASSTRVMSKSPALDAVSSSSTSISSEFVIRGRSRTCAGCVAPTSPFSVQLLYDLVHDEMSAVTSNYIWNVLVQLGKYPMS